MFPSLVLTVGLLVQAAGGPQPQAVTSAPRPPRSPRPPDAVRVWRTDSTAYVQLQQPGQLVVLEVDAIGRIGVLFPSAPWDSTAVSANAPVAVELTPEAQGNPATFIAVRSRWRFDFEALRSGIEWNYDALLLQPTAGDPLAALFDIADRITHGRPYDYGVVTYARDGSVLARGPVQAPDVCLGCVRRAAPVTGPAVAVATNSVDCTNASLTNAFCGVNSGSVSLAAAPPAPPQVIYEPAPVTYTYYPLYPGGAFLRQSRLRFDRPIPTMRPAVPSAFSIAPRLVSPSPGVLGRRP
ncbi:MAG TPA: hypothetical protein VGU74_06785 [Gemmatimonadales bacterium]|nr:hypothetical protein [Gemmatimonadales bacterium]